MFVYVVFVCFFLVSVVRVCVKFEIGVCIMNSSFESSFLWFGMFVSVCMLVLFIILLLNELVLMINLLLFLLKLLMILVVVIVFFEML